MENYKNEKKLWNCLKVFGKVTAIIAASVCILTSIVSIGVITAITGLTSLTGLVLSAGSSYVLETIAACERQAESKKIVIPDEMKCSGNSKSNENMENIKIYAVSPKDMGLEQQTIIKETNEILQQFVSEPANTEVHSHVLRRKMY